MRTAEHTAIFKMRMNKRSDWLRQPLSRRIGIDAFEVVSHLALR